MEAKKGNLGKSEEGFINVVGIFIESIWDATRAREKKPLSGFAHLPSKRPSMSFCFPCSKLPSFLVPNLCSFRPVAQRDSASFEKDCLAMAGFGRDAPRRPSLLRAALCLGAGTP